MRKRAWANGASFMWVALRLEHPFDHNRKHGKEDSAFDKCWNPRDRHESKAWRLVEAALWRRSYGQGFKGDLPSEHALPMGEHPPTPPPCGGGAPEVPMFVGKLLPHSCGGRLLIEHDSFSPSLGVYLHSKISVCRATMSTRYAILVSGNVAFGKDRRPTQNNCTGHDEHKPIR